MNFQNRGEDASNTETTHRYFNEITRRGPSPAPETESVRCPSLAVEVSAEASDPAAVGSQGFGVSVDLSRIFADVRARCLVWVPEGPPGALCVRWLAARLCARLPLPSPTRLALLAPGGLLHPDDPITLLQPNDTVKVIPVDRCPFEDLIEENCNYEKSKQKQDIENKLLENRPESPETRSVCTGEPASHLEPPDLELDAALHEMKQRAFGILEQYAVSLPLEPSPTVPPPPAEPLEPSPTVPPPPAEPLEPSRTVPPPPAERSIPRARRRRVRRRRRPANFNTEDTDAPMNKVHRATVAACSESDEPASRSAVARETACDTTDIPIHKVHSAHSNDDEDSNGSAAGQETTRGREVTGGQPRPAPSMPTAPRLVRAL